MSLTVSEKNEIKAKAKKYLESSIYMLATLCAIDPDEALEATTLDELIASSAVLLPLGEPTMATFQSLFNQITSLNLLR
ncbi:MAG: hypothetical protein RLZZ196_1860 [Bacteroidota bacterium]|jgi:hypothetical protein